MSIVNLEILNDPIKMRYTACVGEGTPADDDEIVQQVYKYPPGSQYTDTIQGQFYVRMDDRPVAGSWIPMREIGANDYNLDFNEDFSIGEE